VSAPALTAVPLSVSIPEPPVIALTVSIADREPGIEGMTLT
jgi:hypothetical protein